MVTINCRIRDELTKDRYPARKHVKWQSSKQSPDGRQAGEKDKKLVKKSEWQMEQPSAVCPDVYAGPQRLSLDPIQSMAPAPVFALIA